MPRPPAPSQAVAGMPGAVFSRIASRLRDLEPEEIFPLHVGDTWLPPIAGCRMEDLAAEAHPALHRYTTPQGHAGLRDKVLRYTNQMLARQQQTGFFAERNRKYLGYHTLTPFAGLVEAALAGGDEIFNQLLPSLLAAYEAQRDKPEGLVIASMARLVHKR